MVTRPEPHPESLWRATATAPESYPELREEVRVDVCVVGGGFSGLSTALHACDAGASVAVLEANDVGWGASGRNGGQVIPGLKHEPDEIVRQLGADRGERLVDFAGRAADVVFDLVARHDIDCGAERSGWISAMHAPPARSLLESRLEQWRSRGADVDWLEGESLTAALGTEVYRAAYLDRRGGKVQPLSYVRGLARAATHAGVRIFAASPARSIARAEGGWRVLTAHGSVVASSVALCTNGYTDGLWPGLARSVIPAFSYQIATEPLGDNLRASVLASGAVVSDTRRLLRYFRLDAEGRCLMGGRGRNVDSSAPHLYEDVVTMLRETFPQLADTPVEHYWGGRVALTDDHLPHLHELAPGIHAALGYNGRGVAMASALGKVLADRLGGRPAEDLPVPTTPVRELWYHPFRGTAMRLAGWWRARADAWEVRRAR